MELVSATNVVKRFGGVVALNGATFSARAGEIHALLGENGAGKSTFIQILIGAVRRDGGSLLLEGNEFLPRNPDDGQACGVAAVFQELSLIPDLTVEQNIWFRREPLNMFGIVDRGRMRRMTTDLMSRYGFPELDPRAKVSRLSLAEQQIVEIAKALAIDPRVIILDEATSSLPASEAQWLMRLARQLASEQRLVIFISHRMDEVRALADRLTIFRNGSTVATHEAKSVSDAEIISQMIGRSLDRLYPPKVASATGTVALNVDGLSNHRLRNVTFDMKEGEVLGVGGLQGHGQRELFEALFGTSSATGKILLWGKPTTIRNPRDALKGKEGIALVPEDRRAQGLLLSKTVRENITLSVMRRFTSYGLVRPKRENELARQIIDFLKIKTSNPEQLAGTLSGGNQQKILLGKMLLTEARVLLLYDPTRGVDVGTKREIFQLMRDLAAKKYSILFYSSDGEELVQVADRVLVLRNGAVAAGLEGERLSKENILAAAMLDGGSLGANAHAS